MHRRAKFSLFSSPSLILLLIVVIFVIEMAESAPSTTDSVPSTADSSKSVQIVYTERPRMRSRGLPYPNPHLCSWQVVPQGFSFEDAAKEALIYSYKTAASGFSAKLTPEQVEQISKLPGVLQVVPSKTLQLHTGLGRLH
ncbi:subtilisin protease [Salix suchowensis]|nr:subtilisin protease [Salix suchowensis]